MTQVFQPQLQGRISLSLYLQILWTMGGASVRILS